MQSIETKYLGATDYKPSRIIARAQAGRVIVLWDHSLDQEANHDAAAKVLCKKFGWTGYVVSGGKADGKGNVYVFVARRVVGAFLVES